MAKQHVKAEKRRFRRRTVRVMVDFQGPDGFRCEYATTLGAGGLFVQTDDPLPVGAQTKMRFRLAEERPLHAFEGHVVWSDDGSGYGRPPGMGVEFRDPGASAALARELDAFD